MMSDKVSIIIPAINEPYLDKTIEELVNKAAGEIEIIVMLDGYWPNPVLKSYKQLTILHFTQIQGFKQNVNSPARIATGKYLMKIDAHCSIAEKYDEILKQDCDENWLVIPSRYRLDAENWKWKDDERIEYLYLTFPYATPEEKNSSLRGIKWVNDSFGNGKNGYYYLEHDKKDLLIDDIIAFQGSMWFCHRKKFLDIGKLYTGKHSFTFHQEAPELTFKFWLSGGKVVINKKLWYAHWHKGKKPYVLIGDNKIKMENFYAWFWMTNQWSKRTRDVEWLIEKFMPMPGWPADWKERQKLFYEKNPQLLNWDLDNNDFEGI